MPRHLLKIGEKFFHSKGKHGKCCICKCGQERSVAFKNQVYCESCSMHIKDPMPKLRFKNTDAKFKCPIQKCKAVNSFKNFWLGKCCKEAAKWTPDSDCYDVFKYVQMIYDQALCAYRMAEKRFNSAPNGKRNAASKNLKKWFESKCFLEQRLVYLFEKSFDRSIMNIQLERSAESKTDDWNPDNMCQICYHDYNEEKHRRSALPCGLALKINPFAADFEKSDCRLRIMYFQVVCWCSTAWVYSFYRLTSGKPTRRRNILRRCTIRPVGRASAGRSTLVRSETFWSEF
ncbi:Oidioi.mRNA.OKI2018_I69.chr1.g1865.t1.cds [Oikopleura dioica]|uniref:Oidioi.mRNA.OKI2018_I69.chr1.g1865.t1.cds n=1 Tax=Oikopleura dioica TaxID=34765 RepID=A0ABN7SPS2_OIKDI|nr:Oidioi.mRNA.OKI2018_I69.chr1.g1865.t1.cds [Oikopleura dioica]